MDICMWLEALLKSYNEETTYRMNSNEVRYYGLKYEWVENICIW